MISIPTFKLKESILKAILTQRPTSALLTMQSILPEKSGKNKLLRNKQNKNHQIHNSVSYLNIAKVTTIC